MAKSKPTDEKNNRWIQTAIKHPGALRRSAKRMGLVKGNEPLSTSDLQALQNKAKKTGNTTLLRRVNLAKTLRRLRGR